MDYDVLVVGAGMTGLMAALRLHALGQRVRLVDKGRSVGGRMATRRVGPGFADFGAQFITAHDASFADLLAHWEEAGLVHPWAAGFAQGSLRPSPDVVFYPRYVARDGMTSLAQHLAHELDVQTQVTVKAVRQVQGGWQVEDAAGGLTLARRVLLTPPVPQSLTLLAAGNVELSAADQAALAAITYDPCLVGLFLAARRDLSAAAWRAHAQPSRSFLDRGQPGEGHLARRNADHRADKPSLCAPPVGGG